MCAVCVLDFWAYSLSNTVRCPWQQRGRSTSLTGMVCSDTSMGSAVLATATEEENGRENGSCGGGGEATGLSIIFTHLTIFQQRSVTETVASVVC